MYWVMYFSPFDIFESTFLKRHFRIDIFKSTFSIRHFCNDLKKSSRWLYDHNMVKFTWFMIVFDEETITFNMITPVKKRGEGCIITGEYQIWCTICFLGRWIRKSGSFDREIGALPLDLQKLPLKRVFLHTRTLSSQICTMWVFLGR